MSEPTPEMTAWVEQQEAAMIRAGLRPYEGPGPGFPWAVGMEAQPVSLRHTKREYVQVMRRAIAQLEEKYGPWPFEPVPVISFPPEVDP